MKESTIISLIGLGISCLAVIISAATAYLAHFRKRVHLIAHTYEDLAQEEADVILVLTNSGNISLIVPMVQVAEKEGNKRTIRHQNESIDRKSKISAPVARSRGNERLLLPGEHLELLFQFPTSINREKAFLQFETITTLGQRLYFEGELSSVSDLSLHPRKRFIQRRTLKFWKKRIFYWMWEKAHLAG